MFGPNADQNNSKYGHFSRSEGSRLNIHLATLCGKINIILSSRLVHQERKIAGADPAGANCCSPSLKFFPAHSNLPSHSFACCRRQLAFALINF